MHALHREVVVSDRHERRSQSRSGRCPDEQVPEDQVHQMRRNNQVIFFNIHVFFKLLKQQLWNSNYKRIVYLLWLIRWSFDLIIQIQSMPLLTNYRPNKWTSNKLLCFISRRKGAHSNPASTKVSCLVCGAETDLVNDIPLAEIKSLARKAVDDLIRGKWKEGIESATRFLSSFTFIFQQCW